jgi:paraquat-inducible protein B
MIGFFPVIAALFGVALIARVGRGHTIEESLGSAEGPDAGVTQFLLHVEDAGLLGAGSPVFFRGIRVGEVAACEPDGGGRGALLRIFVNAPHDNVDGVCTRFWHTSGFDLRLISSGAKTGMPSLESTLRWGIAFGPPDNSK